MSERVGYWRWLGQGFATFPERFLGGMRKALRGITDPTFEVIVGVSGISLSYPLCLIVGDSLSLPLGLVVSFWCTLGILPFFFLLTHGVYREEG